MMGPTVSGAPFTTSVKVAGWLMEPLVPVMTKLWIPAAMVDAVVT